MTFPGNEGVNLGDLLARSGMAQPNAADATRLTPDRRHRQPGSWPKGQTIVRIGLVAIVAILVIGWILSALNS